MACTTSSDDNTDTGAQIAVGTYQALSHSRQRCKDPDFISGSFEPWDTDPDTSKTPLRNVTATSFEGQGVDVTGTVFWAKMSLVP